MTTIDNTPHHPLAAVVESITKIIISSESDTAKQAELWGSINGTLFKLDKAKQEKTELQVFLESITTDISLLDKPEKIELQTILNSIATVIVSSQLDIAKKIELQTLLNSISIIIVSSESELDTAKKVELQAARVEASSKALENERLKLDQSIDGSAGGMDKADQDATANDSSASQHNANDIGNSDNSGAKDDKSNDKSAGDQAAVSNADSAASDKNEEADNNQ